MHAHFGTNSTEVVMLANVLGGPAYSFTVHGPEEFDKPQFLHMGEKVRRAAFVAAVSSYGRSQLYRWVAHEHWGKVKVVHCGLERGFHDVAPVNVPCAPRLVCVGRLCEQKGQLLLLEAAHRLAAQSIDFELVLAGDGEMREEIGALIARHGLQAQVRITGWISSAQVREEILAARALVLPSFAEGLPVVIMEAMALRRPVLTTYVAGIPELVRPGENGWLFLPVPWTSWRQPWPTAWRNRPKCCSTWAKRPTSESCSGMTSTPRRPGWPAISRHTHDKCIGLVTGPAGDHRPGAGVGAVAAGVAGLPAGAVEAPGHWRAPVGSGVGACPR